MMTRDQIDEVLERVRTWSEEEQERAVRLLLVLEENREGIYELSNDEIADIEEAEAQAERGEFATDEEMRALFDRYRNP
jgi:predicted transcriptional regulator